jgi:hypothetical protein
MKRRLPLFELFSAISSRYRDNLIIAVEVDHHDLSIEIWFADFRWTRLGFEWFEEPCHSREPPVTWPDFDDVEIIDCGNTLRLGKFEAAADCIRDTI